MGITSYTQQTKVGARWNSAVCIKRFLLGWRKVCMKWAVVSYQ